MKKFLLLLLTIVSIMAFSFAVGCSNDSETTDTTLKTMSVSLSSKSFDYDGNAHSLEIEGELPEKAIVVWQNNSLTDVGEKLVFANVKCVGYEERNFKATLTVVGQDMASEISLKTEQIDVAYKEDYSFALNDESLLPAGAVLTEIYINTRSGEIVDGKPNFGGEFRYVLQITAPGYNAKIIYGELNIARPNVESVEITNLPQVAINKYFGKSALIPGVKWVPEVNLLPEGHKDVEYTFSSSNSARIKYENGAFVALDNPGDCKITVSIKGTNISSTYTVFVADCSYLYEDFEDESKTLYTQNYVMYKNELGQQAWYIDENGQSVLVPKYKQLKVDASGLAILDANGKPQFEDINPTYYATFSSNGTTSEIISQSGSRVMHVSGIENFGVYYSFLQIDAQPTGGWTTGTYRIEMDVTGDYGFFFSWTRNASDSMADYYLVANSGVEANEAVIEDGKIIIEWTIRTSDLGDTNVLKFAQNSKEAFDFTVDNVLIYKIA